MDIEKTCGNCENLEVAGHSRAAFAGCGLTGYAVPHEWIGENSKFTFWRIPVDCPRTDNVKKSEKQAPKKDWVIKVFSDFEVK